VQIFRETRGGVADPGRG